MNLIVNTHSKGLALIIFIAAATLFSCKKAEKLTPVKAGQTTPADVYVAGTVLAANGNTIAAYWKNGALVKLGDSTINSYAHYILVSGTDIYVAGGSYTSTTHDKAIYWHNGIATELTDGTIQCYIAGLALSGSNLYIAGNFDELNGIAYAAHWINTPVSLVIDSAVLSYETGVAMLGADVYVSGFRFKEWANNMTGVQVKNNQGTTLQLHTMPTAVATGGSDIYMSGALYSNLGFFSSAVVWKNGVATRLGDTTTTNQFATAIAVSGSDVYLAGRNGLIGNNPLPQAVYWKNGNMVILQGSSSTGGANYIAVAGNDVYATGEINGGAGYWLNGVPAKLPGANLLMGIQVIPK